ncbi:endosomal P24A protein-like protein [Tothia fuscella]|uniref:Transmembrane 9 superfamily member n=1 Tax=Tothia fuscella TaxID=1048955 RepID=A0A9P4NI61_9PEZI|nr:endosomal P24A protein-like protein [Tothia fuscella]
MRLRRPNANPAETTTTTLLKTLLLLSLSPLPASSFYLPGVAPTSYKTGDLVPLHVNHLTPADSDTSPNVQSVFAYDYYHPEFHFCQPDGGPKPVSESLGSIIFGDRIFTSPFQLRMNVAEGCKAVCERQDFEGEDGALVNMRILQNYNLNWLIDGLPAGQMKEEVTTGEKFATPGFPLGHVDERDGTPMLNTHYDIEIEFHQASKEEYRVVGVMVEASSRGDSAIVDGEAKCGTPGNAVPLKLSETARTRVLYTYSVRWKASATPFATRWDKYLHVYDPKIHWFSLVNSAVIVCFLVGMVSTILLRTLRKDIARYNRLDQVALEDLSGTGIMDDGVQEDSGWKLVHGDVFRPPKYPLALAVLLGNGAQLFMMAGFTIAFALFGFLSPSSRGSLGTVMILFYILFNFAGGYTSARIYKFFHGEGWKRNFLYTPLILPLSVFAVFFFLNLFVWARQASGAVPFTTMLVLVLIWFIISLPLSFAGSWLGFKASEISSPVRTNQIPRQIPPPSSGYMRPIPSMLLVGVLPFGAIFVELYFIMNSIWTGKVYYMFGFLFVCYGLMIITVAAVTVLMVYFLLCAENYHWQWRAFFTAGASAAYVFGYGMLFWARGMSFASWTSGILYLGYSALISALFFVLCGTIGFFATFLFVLKIYGSIKVD